MGQYFKVVNLDKKEYLAPANFRGCGMKLGECWGEMWLALTYLLAQGFGPDSGWQRGEVVGRWAGDRIVIIGDYHESGLYQQLKGSEYQNITHAVRDYFEPPTEEKSRGSFSYPEDMKSLRLFFEDEDIE